MNEKDIREKKQEIEQNDLMRDELKRRENENNLYEKEENVVKKETTEETDQTSKKREIPENPHLKESEKSPLGKVEVKPMTNRKVTNVGDEGMKEITDQRRGIPVDLKRLPSKGAFYPHGSRIFVKSAKTSEIKDFSLMDEDNPLDINDKLNNILSSCTTVMLGGRNGSYKDLLEDDKMFIVLSIRELTFPKGESKLTMKSVCDNCDHENHFELRTENLQYFEEKEKLQKYYSPEDRCYIVETKSIGSIILSPPKIGVMQEITTYARTKQEKREKWDKAAVQILPYLNLNWRGLNEEYIFQKLTEMNGWTEKKFSLVLRLTEWMRSGIKPTLTYGCEKCHNNLDVEVKIESGMKSLFVRTDADLEDELL